MKRLGRYLFLLFVVAVVLATCLFAIQNSEKQLTIKFAFWESETTPAAVVVFSAFLVGVLLTGLFSLFAIVNRDMKIRKARKLQVSLEREIDALRNQPLYEESAPAQKRNSTHPLLNEDR